MGGGALLRQQKQAKRKNFHSLIEKIKCRKFFLFATPAVRRSCAGALGGVREADSASPRGARAGRSRLRRDPPDATAPLYLSAKKQKGKIFYILFFARARQNFFY